jgi:putative ABC transport system substrate-binding protein
MKRGTFIAGLGSAAAWPLAARTQQAAIPMIGYLGTRSASGPLSIWRAIKVRSTPTGMGRGSHIRKVFATS